MKFNLKSLENLQRDDKGYYTCTVTSKYGASDRKAIMVHVGKCRPGTPVPTTTQPPQPSAYQYPPHPQYPQYPQNPQYHQYPQYYQQQYQQPTSRARAPAVAPVIVPVVSPVESSSPQLPQALIIKTADSITVNQGQFYVIPLF